VPVWVCGRTFEGMGVTIRFCVKERQWHFWQKEGEREGEEGERSCFYSSGSESEW